MVIAILVGYQAGDRSLVGCVDHQQDQQNHHCDQDAAHIDSLVGVLLVPEALLHFLFRCGYLLLS